MGSFLKTGNLPIREVVVVSLSVTHYAPEPSLSGVTTTIHQNQRACGRTNICGRSAKLLAHRPSPRANSFVRLQFVCKSQYHVSYKETSMQAVDATSPVAS